MELSVPFSPLIVTFFTLVFFSFEVVFENCKCGSWCRPDDLVSSLHQERYRINVFKFNFNLL